jgi:hypothetical protein
MKRLLLLLALAWSSSSFAGTSIIDPGGTGSYNSINAWVAAKARDFIAAAEGETAILRCTNGAAFAASTINGATTNSTYKWTIQSDTSYRFTGSTYETGNRVRVEGTDTSVFYIQDDYVDVIGLQIGVTQSTNAACYGIRIANIAAQNQINISKCIVKGLFTSTTNYYEGMYVYDADAVVNVFSSIFYNFANGGSNAIGIISSSCSAVNIYNSTVFNCYAGIKRTTAGTVTAKNLIVCNNTDDFNGTITIDYCATDDGDGSNRVTFTGGSASWGNIFTDYSSGDFSLKNYTSSEKVIGAGMDNPSVGLYSDDVLGNSRSSTWDMGAFEYVAAATYFPYPARDFTGFPLGRQPK